MADWNEGVLDANAHFYRVLSMADRSAMSQVWIRSPDVSCVHPGWRIITGYDPIQQSWEAIFINQGPMRVWPSGAAVKQDGEVAVVTCYENIDASATARGRIVRARAINVFRRTGSGWKMLHHHATALPGEERRPAFQRLANN